ncbi:MAG: chemotaxis protein CheA [Planctomycetaceae bacterium]|nr:chemotaxis protein CheA [Planctomycetaceae bacterium]
MSNSEILREFLLETHENLALLDSDLITLEKEPAERNTLAQVFRTLHSVKGTAGFLGLVKLQAVAHSAESLLSKLRAGEMRFTPTIATAMLSVVDAIREMLASIETFGNEGSGEYSALIAEVDRLREAGDGEVLAAQPAEAALLVTQPVIELPVAPPPMAHVTTPTPPLIIPSPAETIALPPLESASDAKAAHVSDSNIRVDVGLLDKLMTLVGELVLSRNQILQHSASHEDDAFLGAVQRLNLLTTELQASVMKTRMQPIGNVLNKFPRVVRDLALACGKKVRFEMDGQDTELDKTLIEAIRDPLTHMVRNAIDHGIEPPEIRKSRGKSAEGRLRMVACHEGGKVIIEITDDGGGIDVARVRDKALSAKLVSPEVVARMSRQEILRLIFLPGFSTAASVTQFSGRGVGMDVVRTNIEKIGGTVDVESPQGQGTTIRTKIPLTLAIIPALIIDSGGERYAIPQVSLLELVSLNPDQALRGIERMHGAPVYRLRGTLLPLVFLDEQLQIDVTRGVADDLNIIVLQADDRPFGLVVDAIRDTEEIVVKPLQKQLKGISVFSGAAIMGDGRVALVLDVLGLAQRASVISGAKSRTLGEQERPTAPVASAGQTLLLFAPTAGGQMAMPLSLVARLEEFPRTALENLGARPVVQYFGHILPLVDVSEELECLRLGRRSLGSQRRRHSVSDAVSVVVCAAGDQQVGLVIDRFLDIVDDHVADRSRANRPGVLFTSIIQEQVTEFIDVAALVRAATIDLLPHTT